MYKNDMIKFAQTSYEELCNGILYIFKNCAIATNNWFIYINVMIYQQTQYAIIIYNTVVFCLFLFFLQNIWINKNYSIAVLFSVSILLF